MSNAIKELPAPLKRAPRESDSAHAALIRYYEMGSGRSLQDLHNLLTEQAGAGIAVPTESYHTLSSWCSRFDWNARIERVQEQQYAAEIEELHKARVDFVRKQIDMLEMWEKILIMGQPALDDVNFSEWSRSAKDFVKTVGAVFGLEDRQQNAKVEVNVHNEQRPADTSETTQELLGLLKSARERAELEAATGDQEIVDIESRPVRQEGEGERLDSE
jgi:hypothetical protein